MSVPTPPPYTLGMDVCGVVDAAGAGAEEWIGQRVVAITKTALGGIAEYAIAPAVSVFDAPPELDDAEATAFLLTFHTSHLALFRRGRLQAGETVVIHSAASGLGSAGIQLAQAAGARVIAVAGGPEKGALCRELGADLVIDHTAEDFVEAVLAGHRRRRRRGRLRPDRAATSSSARGAARPARAATWPSGFADDDDNGMTGRPLRMACIGNISIVGVMLAWADEVDPGMRRFGFNPFGRDVADEVHADLLRLVAEGKIRPAIGTAGDHGRGRRRARRPRAATLGRAHRRDGRRT